MKVKKIRFVEYVWFAMRVFFYAMKHRKHYMGLFVAPKDVKESDWKDFEVKHRAYLRRNFRKMQGK